MDDATIQDSIVNHLQQAHAMERAQLGELRTLADEVDVPAIAGILRAHIDETARQGDRLEQRLFELGSGNSLRMLAQSFGAAIPKSMVDRIRGTDTLAILRDAIGAEAEEVAAYLLLETEAVRGGDDSTAVLASEIRVEEHAVRQELMTFWNQAVDREVARRVLDSHQRESEVLQAMLVDHLQDVHVLERSAAVSLTTARATIRDELARRRVEDHREATLRHGSEVSRRLTELGAGPSLRKQAQGYAAAALKGPIDLVRDERAAKDMRDMYVVEQLELVAYAQLEAIADRAGDERTLQLAQAHAAEEAAMADWLERECARFLLESLAEKA